MGITDDLQELINDTCTWAPLVSRDLYGVPTFGQVNTYPCRYSKKMKMLRDKDNQQVYSGSQVVIAPSLISGVPFPAVKNVDRVILSDGLKPQIMDTEQFQDDEFPELGPTHTVVYFV